jgi:peptidoglycan L-alanyl-D-glutamate endopeptidase CwlK
MVTAMSLGAKSLARLKGVHPDLIAVVRECAATTPLDFIVTEGVRTMARQKQLMAAGATRTLNSRHLTGHAVDLAAVVDGEIRWDWPLYQRLATAMKEAAGSLNIPIEWGGDWRFKDGPHFQLPWKSYPQERDQ